MKAIVVASLFGLFLSLVSYASNIYAHEITPRERTCVVKSPNGKGKAILVITPSRKRVVDGLSDDMPLIGEIYVRSAKGKRLYTLFNEQQLSSPVAKTVYLQDKENYKKEEFTCPDSPKTDRYDVIDQDLNFDGYYDIAIIHIHEYACCRNPQYDTWIYDPHTSRYVYSEDYSLLTLNQLHLHSEEKIVVAGAVGGACLYIRFAYRVEGSNLKPLLMEERNDCTENDALYTVSKPDRKGNLIENKNVVLRERRTNQQKTPLEEMLNLNESSYTNVGAR